MYPTRNLYQSAAISKPIIVPFFGSLVFLNLVDLQIHILLSNYKQWNYNVNGFSIAYYFFLGGMISSL